MNDTSNEPMDLELTELARAAVACRSFRWVPGMRCIAMRAEPLEPIITRVPDNTRGWKPYENSLPDLRDAATLGCLLMLARKAWQDETLYVRLSDDFRLSDGKRAWEANGWCNASTSPDKRPGAWRAWGFAHEAETIVACLRGAHQ
jgi:hypothetical protein